MQRVVAGAVAGLGATVPMTAAMMAMHRQLPRGQQYPLPPRQITMNAAGKAGVREHLDEPERTGLSLVAHFSFGTFVGALFGIIAPRELSRSIPAGICYGVLVWVASYLGFIPALRLLPPATRHPKERNGLMIAAHMVWGAAAGALVPLLTPPHGEDRRHAGR